MNNFNINSIDVVVYAAIFKLAAEYDSGTYKTLKECPGYDPVNNFCKCYNSIAEILFEGEELEELLISPEYFIE